MLIDGLLIPAGNLVNGTTIRLEAREEDELEFFNIKMESHDAIYAEGTAVETMLGVNEGAVNFAEYFRMYGMPKTSGTPSAPFVSYGGGRDELKSRIRSAVSPWVDCREQIDVIRDRLEERAVALTRELAPINLSVCGYCPACSGLVPFRVSIVLRSGGDGLTTRASGSKAVRAAIRTVMTSGNMRHGKPAWAIAASSVF